MSATMESAREFASAWLLGEWTFEGMVDRTLRLLGRRRCPRSLRFLIGGFWRDLRDRPDRRRLEPLARSIAAHPLFAQIEARIEDFYSLDDAPVMAEAPGPWSVPRISTVGELGEWLDLTPTELVWLADRAGIAGHYRRHWHGKRLIEAPGRRLAAAQRRLLRGVLTGIPVHANAHGFCAGRSVLSAVQPHAGRPFLLVMDLRSFFPSVRAARVHAMLQRVGYPEEVARTITALCTTRCDQLPRGGAQPEPSDRYRRRHLPQGAPSSPALANLVAHRLDARLTGWAKSMDARYTRYADDLIFSGSRSIGRPGFVAGVHRIVTDEGFELNDDKTRGMGQSVRQTVLGLVVNHRPTVPREEFERLEATLFNHARSGPIRQPDLEQQLRGRVAWVRQVDPARARRLEELFSSIEFA